MAGPTKMIIITSDEDIIRQFSSNNNNKNTHIIDLDKRKQMNSTAIDNNNDINLDFLAHLSELNSNNDQVFKRALDASDDHQPKPVKASKKSLDMICSICGDYAIGYNYDALSCASCKAFFRRNANQDLDKFRCLSGSGQCSVAHGTRRKCQKCRLDRCFSVGMRKDFILSDEERQRRKQRLEINRSIISQRVSTSDSASDSTPLSSTSNILSSPEALSPTSGEIDRLLMDIIKEEGNIQFDENINLNEINELISETLPVEDWITVETLRSSFISLFKEHVIIENSLEAEDRTSALINWSFIAEQNALRFIKFFRQIPEFESLDIEDRLTLTKYNLFPIYPVLKCFYYNPTLHYCEDPKNPQAVKHLRFFKLCFDLESIRDSFMILTTSLVEITDQDPGVLSLILVILIFCQGLSMSDNEPTLKDSLAAYRAQSYYTNILWNYMINKWGELETCRRFSSLLTAIFRMQLTAKITRDYYRSEFKTPDVVEKLAPLMQTMLQIC